jgi:hypothetical protein
LSAEFQLAELGVAQFVLIGAVAFAARWLMAHIPLRVHTLLMEAVVLIGGAGFLWRAFF